MSAETALPTLGLCVAVAGTRQPRHTHRLSAACRRGNLREERVLALAAATGPAAATATGAAATATTSAAATATTSAATD
jgi:hypothetical protein